MKINIRLLIAVSGYFLVTMAAAVDGKPASGVPLLSAERAYNTLSPRLHNSLPRAEFFTAPVYAADGAPAMTNSSEDQISHDARKRNPPNLLFILTDQHRADGVGAYGKKGIQTEVLTADAIEFIKSSKRPFYGVVSYYPPHPPYSVPRQFEKMYEDLYPEDERRRKYYAMCTAIDESVGRLLKTLEEEGISEQTLVVFTTEHGHHFNFAYNNHEKRTCYDEAARIPLLMRFPGVIPPGQVSNALINSVDLYPTLSALLGFTVQDKIDGLNQSEFIRQRASITRDYLVIENVPFIDKTTKPHRPAYEKGVERCIVTDQWKLILSTLRKPELYRRGGDDPEENNNLWEQFRDLDEVRRLKSHLRSWSIKTNDPLTHSLIHSWLE